MSDAIGYLTALRKSSEPQSHDHNSKLELLSAEDAVVDNVQCRVSKYVVDDSAHRFDGMKASDFFLGNLQAAGVDLRMQFCRSSNMSAVDNLEHEILRMHDFSSRIKKIENSKTD